MFRHASVYFVASICHSTSDQTILIPRHLPTFFSKILFTVSIQQSSGIERTVFTADAAGKRWILRSTQSIRPKRTAIRGMQSASTQQRLEGR